MIIIKHNFNIYVGIIVAKYKKRESVSKTCYSGLAQNQYKWQRKSVFYGKNMYG